jgi:hypothetical protein
MKKQLITDNRKMLKGLSHLSDTMEWIGALLRSEEDPEWVLQTIYEAEDEVTDLIRLVQNSATA